MPISDPAGGLRPFEDNTCPKCGGTAPTLEFCDGCSVGRQYRGQPRKILDIDPRNPLHGEAHHKTCNTCRYEWLSACKDAKR